MIKIEALDKKYGETRIFDKASCSFPDKGLVCVLGPSGCGKSTLLGLIAGFDRDFGGRIFVHGRSLAELDSDSLCAYRRDEIGFVFQNYHLVSGYTALENILLASDAAGTDRAESRPKAEALLKKLGLSDKAGQKTETLSGGQKQRVAIGRALINDPSLILADEPTGALDRKNSDEIMALLKELSKECLVLVITHDRKCAEYSDQLVTITDGKLNGIAQDADPEGKSLLKKVKSPRVSMLKRALMNFGLRLPKYAAIALALSIGVLCFALSLSSGNIIDKSISDFKEKNTACNNAYIRLDGDGEELLELLEEDERLENVYLQYVLSDLSLRIGGESQLMTEKYPLPKSTAQMSYGHMPRRGENEIALSPSLAAKFEKNIQDLIGKEAELLFDGQSYFVTVSGIFNASYDDLFVSSDIEQALYEKKPGEAYSLSYDVAEFENIVPVSSGLKDRGVQSQNASAEVAALQDTFENLKRLFFTVSVLIFAVGCFISAVLLIKQQNTRFHELGLLAALGYGRRSIQALLFWENLALSALSALLTLGLTALALALGKAAGYPLVLTAPQVLAAVCLAAALILTLSSVSALRLINTEPAEALR